MICLLGTWQGVQARQGPPAGETTFPFEPANPATQGEIAVRPSRASSARFVRPASLLRRALGLPVQPVHHVPSDDPRNPHAREERVFLLLGEECDIASPRVSALDPSLLLYLVEVG